MLNLAPEPTEGDYSGGEGGIHESNKTPLVIIILAEM